MPSSIIAKGEQGTGTEREETRISVHHNLSRINGERRGRVTERNNGRERERGKGRG